MFEVSGLHSGYDGTIIIEDININVQHDEIVTIIGPNGSGKSTILNTISNLVEHKNGTINFENNLILQSILITHHHSDHTSGLPDMRAMSLINNKIIPAYMPENMKDQILSHYKYIFKGDKDYSPFMEIQNIEEKFFFKLN